MPSGVCLASDGQPYQQGRELRNQRTSVELIPKVPLGLALPTVAIMGLLTLLQREAVALIGLGGAVAPMGICVSKVPLLRLHHDSWAQTREERRGLQGMGLL